MYSIVYTKKAVDDIPKRKAAKLEKKAKALIEVIRENPYQTPGSCGDKDTKNHTQRD